MADLQVEHLLAEFGLGRLRLGGLRLRLLQGIDLRVQFGDLLGDAGIGRARAGGEQEGGSDEDGAQGQGGIRVGGNIE
jgi:hypothetical protein